MKHYTFLNKLLHKSGEKKFVKIREGKNRLKYVQSGGLGVNGVEVPSSTTRE